ncbi:MAG: DinB family protein [Acidobacteriota bacterium]|nr:DinB family protein [Acidobacteriota bacterium]
MNNDESLRKHLLHLLKDGGAHLNFDAAVKDFPAGLQGKRPHGAPHSAWELLEHMRIAQWDILEFIRNPNHVSPEFPGGYWPKEQAPSNETAWNNTVEAFRRDLTAIAELVAESKDLFAQIPHGDGQTILREALLVADHNTYHLGELVFLSRLLGARP